MGVLEKLMEPAVVLMNRQIQASTPARELCAELDGRIFAVRVRDTALAAYFVICPTRVSLHASVDGDADVIISGSLLSLARLAATNDEALIRDGLVDLTGDAILALKFRKLLAFGRPDLEEELSRVVGDVAAHETGKIFRRVSEWGRQAGETIARDFVEYFQEESRTLPSRFEANSFSDEVNTLRDDVARFAARLKEVESKAMLDRS